MPKKEDDNPLEEIQKQLRDLMNNKSVQVAFAPFMESMRANLRSKVLIMVEVTQSSPRKKTLPEMKSWNRFVALIVVQKKLEITWIAL